MCISVETSPYQPEQTITSNNFAYDKGSIWKTFKYRSHYRSKITIKTQPSKKEMPKVGYAYVCV